MRYFPVLIGFSLLAACSSSKDEPQPTGTEAELVITPPTAGLVVAKARKVDEHSDLIEFAYSYPAEAAANLKLKAWLDADLDKQRADLTADARMAFKNANDRKYSFNPYGHWTEWKVVTDLPGWLSLSAQRSQSEGGAHGIPWAEGLLWDRAANTKRDPRDLFVSATALSAAIRAPFCDLLDAERAKRRGEPVDRTSGDLFTECIDPAEEAVILGSSDKQHFNRLGILVAPYEAGPYAEGFYEVTLPVTPEVLKAVKPEFRQYFAAKR